MAFSSCILFSLIVSINELLRRQITIYVNHFSNNWSGVGSKGEDVDIETGIKLQPTNYIDKTNSSANNKTSTNTSTNTSLKNKSRTEYGTFNNSSNLSANQAKPPVFTERIYKEYQPYQPYIIQLSAPVDLGVGVDVRADSNMTKVDNSRNYVGSSVKPNVTFIQQ